MREFFQTYGPLLVMIVQFIVLWVLWSLRKNFCTTERCEEHRKALLSTHAEAKSETSGEIRALKSKIEKLPDREEIREFSREVGKLNNALGELKGRLTGIGRAVDLMNQHLLNNGKEVK